MKATAVTLGCKVNQYESQSMLSQLQAAGFTLCESPETSDIVLINSCTVTATSDHKVRQTLRHIRRENPGAVIVLTGCMPQAFPELAESLSDADIVLGNTNRASLLPHILTYLSSRQRIVDIAPHTDGETFERMSVEQFYEHTRAFVKIEDGCNRFCSYCIIPYARGRVRSKPLPDLNGELLSIAERGYSEVVLTGINLSAYGQEFGLHLCDAVETACSIPKIRRVRLGSLEPEQLTRETIERLSRQEKLCPQFHLSLQSGCDETLRRMNRHYTSGEYREIVENLRAVFPDAAVTTDIMVGFPGETECEFSDSLAFAQEIGFARAHIFSYSRRPGTRANDFPEQIPNRIKEERSRRMIEVTRLSRDRFFSSLLGKTQETLFERELEPGWYEGYTANYTPVKMRSDLSLCGKIVTLRITGTDGDFCIGSL